MEIEITPEPTEEERAAILAALGGFAAAGAWGDRVAWWGLLVAVVLTWVSGLDYARSAPALFRGRAGTTPA